MIYLTLNSLATFRLEFTEKFYYVVVVFLLVAKSYALFEKLSAII